MEGTLLGYCPTPMMKRQSQHRRGSVKFSWLMLQVFMFHPAALKLLSLVLCTFPGFCVQLLLRASIWDLETSFRGLTLSLYHSSPTQVHTHTHRTESGWELSTLHSLPSTALLITDWFRRSKLTPLPLGWANSWVIHKFSVGYMV